MFNLEQSIAEWRRQMLAAGINTPDVLSELESHLRDDVERQVRSGVNAPQAFGIAVRNVGSINEVKAEFAKTYEKSGAQQKLMGFICASLVGFIVLMSGFTFFFIGFSLGEQIVAYAAVTMSLLVACRWRYAVPFLPVFPNPKRRTALGFLFIVSGFVCSNFFAEFILPNFGRGDGQIPALGFWLLFPIAVGFGLAGGIQEVARKQTTTAVS